MTVSDSFLSSENEEFQHLFESVIDKLSDESGSVSRTAKWLLSELQKMFPEIIKQVYEKLSYEF